MSIIWRKILQMNRASILALYLPQFHRVAENDKWWGEGFTDWVAVREAKPLFEGHFQPHEPLNDNYYNLLEHDVMSWQAKLMHKYSIDAICMYHYWFDSEHKLLEKPAENLLQWTDIDMPFCFCWANESWARTWSKLNDVNVWSDVYDSLKKPEENGLLVEQKYGDRKEWEKHFKYMLPFFKDTRYLKNGNRPVFVIYKPANIPCLDRMINCWNELCEAEELGKIYLIGMDNSDSDVIDECCIRQPENAVSEMLSANNFILNKNVKTFDYKKIYENITADTIRKKKTCLCSLVEIDTTPRKGKKGWVISEASPKLFQNYLTELLKISSVNKTKYLFINAWNEWGEGMHLEPDKKNGYGYLEAVKAAVDYCENINVSEEEIVEIKSVQDEYYKRWLRKQEIHDRFDKLNLQWDKNNEKGMTIEKYLQQKGVKKIAIYGLGKMAGRLISELEKSSVEIVYGMDRNIKNEKYPFQICKIDEECPKVDEIIITPILHTQKEYDDVALKFKSNVEIECLEKIIIDCR